MGRHLPTATVGHVFCQTFNRDVLVWFACRNYNSFPGNQARITRFRVIERFLHRN